MKASANNTLVDTLYKSSGTILWLTGWSMPDCVFDRLREMMPEYEHVSARYNEMDSSENMLNYAETTVRNIMLYDQEVCRTRPFRRPLLAAGWSLGGMLALKLAAKGYVDGLVLFGATAQFTRPKEGKNLGWADACLRHMIKGITKDRQAVEVNFRSLMFTERERESDVVQSLPPIGSWTTAALISGLQFLRDEECLSELQAIACPVLIIHGAEDKICPYDAARELQNQLSEAKLVTLLSCGHAPFWRREEKIAQEWRKWLDEQRHNQSYSEPI